MTPPGKLVEDGARESLPVSGFLANLFDLRWVLGRCGHDPCDEWDIDTLMGLPDGLSFRDGEVQFECRNCERWSQYHGEVNDFDIDDDMNLCGGSPRCCP